MRSRMYGVVFILSNFFTVHSQPTGCTEEGKVCPDGFVVSRDPNLNCHFPPCPSESHTDQYCQAEEFFATCPSGSVIVIDDAQYGRMNLGKCITYDMGYIGCGQNVIHIADRKCSGMSSCSIKVPNAELLDTQPCIKELVSYLEVTYHCEQVMQPDDTDSCDNTVNNMTLLRGNLTTSTHCGTVNKPWVLSALPGQTINLTLIDFNAAKNQFHYQGEGESNVEICQPYGIVTDSADQESRQICGRGHYRVSHVYNSLSNHVSLTFNTDSTENRFMVQFQVLGCPDMIPPDGVWYTRLSHDRASMGCKARELTWFLHCEGHAWVGSKGNCSAPMAVGRGKNDVPTSGIHIGIAIAIILGAALLVGSIIVCVGVARYRRREPPDLMNQYTTQTMLIRQRPPTGDEYEMRCTCPVPQQGQKVSHTLHRPQRTPQEPRHATLHRSPQVPRHYSLNQTVQVNGNDYEHIWQTPLPKSPPVAPQVPDSTENNEEDQVNTSVISEEPPVCKDEETDRDRPYYIRSKDIYSGPEDPAKVSLLADPPQTIGGYSTLRKTPKHSPNRAQPADV